MLEIAARGDMGASRRSAKMRGFGEVDEWFKSHAWKACVR